MSEKRAIEDPARLTGPEKAAVMLLALGDEGESIWQHLDEEEIRTIAAIRAQFQGHVGKHRCAGVVDAQDEDLRGCIVANADQAVRPLRPLVQAKAALFCDCIEHCAPTRPVI